MNKENIVNEIKRVVKKNNGAPFGPGLFSKETGIKRYDWGKYWVLWSDALLEAGFTPNKFQNAEEKNQSKEQIGCTPTPVLTEVSEAAKMWLKLKEISPEEKDSK